MSSGPLAPGTSLLVARMREIAKGLDTRNAADRASFAEIKKLADDIQEILDRAGSDLRALERRGDEILNRIISRIETRGSA